MANAFTRFVRRGRRIIIAPIQLAWRRFRQKIRPGALMNKVFTDIKTEYGHLRDKPTSMDQYFRIGRRYVAKKLAYLSVLLGIIFLSLFSMVGWPWIVSKFFTRTFVVNSEKMQGYNGKVRLLDNPKDRQTIFLGRLEGGRISGEGTLYDYDGNKLYQGDFLMEVYDGKGELYYKNGKTCYKGDFVSNQYEGNGTLYYESGQMEYKGSFVGGKYEGIGTLYSPSGTVRYTGSFAQGQYEGNGRLYDENSQLRYEGSFSGGLFSGQGRYYSKTGKLKYEGNYANGRKNGSGTHYRKGLKIYTGTFEDDKKIEGVFTKRNEEGEVFYEGETSHRVPDGKGTWYKEGKVVYEGEFKEGEYEGEGTLYDDDETVVYKGDFVGGEY
ncbi:MAG: hypothetical protein IJ679_05605, partial [Lachnospiraceae bacterium]|nr:hypothetical protein [Lachnospiraceae bacterium]